MKQQNSPANDAPDAARPPAPQPHAAGGTLIKPVQQMDYGELQRELAAAQQQRQIAEYQDGLANWQAAVDGANARLRAVNDEIDARLAALRDQVPGAKTHGG